METNLKEINSYTRQLDITIAWELIQDEYEKEFSQARSNYSMKGFRKGKVPESIVKKNYLQLIKHLLIIYNLVNDWPFLFLHDLKLIPK